MLLRLRSRDGLERIEIGENASIGDLLHLIGETLSIALYTVTLSKDPKLLTDKNPERFTDLANHQQSLSSYGIRHGDMVRALHSIGKEVVVGVCSVKVFMHYPFEREVQSTAKRTPFEGRSFGAKMTVEDLIAKQTRIERQESPHCASVSFDRHAANVFQQYILAGLAFSIKRGGLLYGSIDDNGNVLAQAIFEPPQEGSADTLLLERGTAEEQRADFIARVFGWTKVGWVFAQSSGQRDYILSVDEICQMAAVQNEMGQEAVSGVVSMSPDGDVHFEAFQVSDQCMRLFTEGWFQQGGASIGVAQLQDPREPKKKDPVIVAGKDVGEVDVDYFLIPVNIRDHEGPLQCAFPIENRLLPQGPSELKQHLQRTSKLPYYQRLSDFHLLLYLSKQPNFDLEEDITTIAEAVKHKANVPEGYSLIIDSLAMG